MIRPIRLLGLRPVLNNERRSAVKSKHSSDKNYYRNKCIKIGMHGNQLMFKSIIIMLFLLSIN